MKSLFWFNVLILIFANIISKSHGHTGLLKHRKLKQDNQTQEHNYSSNAINISHHSHRREAGKIKGNCLVEIDGWWYNLYPLSLRRNKSYLLKAKNGMMIDFNICDNIKTNCENREGMVVDKGQCVRYADTWKKDKKWVLVYDDSKSDKGTLILKLPQGDAKCKDGKASTVTYEIICDPEANTPKIINEDDFDPERCNNTIRLVSQHACKSERYVPWYETISLGPMELGYLFIFFGSFLLLIGHKIYPISALFIIAVGGGIFMNYFLSLFFQVDPLIAVLLGAACSIPIGLWYDKFITFALCGIVAFLMGTFLYYLTIHYINIEANTLFFLDMLASFTFFGLLGCWAPEIVSIISCALIGSFTCVRGAGFCAGGFPDETYVSKLIMNRELNQLHRIFSESMASTYIKVFLISFVVSVLLQYCLYYPAETKGDQKKGKESQAPEKSPEAENLMQKKE